MRIKQTNKQRDVQGEKLLSRVEKIYQDVIGRQLTCDFDERGSEEYEQGVQFFFEDASAEVEAVVESYDR